VLSAIPRNLLIEVRLLDGQALCGHEIIDGIDFGNPWSA